MQDIIRLDLVVHSAKQGGTNGPKKASVGGGDGKSKNKTPEEIRDQQNRRDGTERAKAERNSKKLIRNTAVYTAIAARKTIQVGTEAANLVVNNSFVRQMFDAEMQGDTRRSQLLQNQKTKVNAATSFATTQAGNAFSAVAGLAISKTLGIAQIATYVAQLGLDLVGQYVSYQEKLRQYQLTAERQLASSEYARKRLLTNTFNNRGFF